MKKNTFTKALTLCSFVVLLSGFVAFKNGSFNELLSENNVSAYPNFHQLYFPPDSPMTVPSRYVGSPEMLSSSKSLVLPERRLKFESIQFPDGDSTKKGKTSAGKTATATTANPVRNSPNIMPSSKSMMLPEKKIEFDTSKKQQKKPK